MIHCTINGKVTYPSTSEKIKVTYANQFIEDSGTYTYDISFPMSVHANQVVFNNVHRFDVHKRITAFDDCKLYVDNRLIIDGKGTVTSVTESKLKLQIVGGKSRIKYNSNFERHFIDEIDYPKVYVTCGIDRAVYGVCGVDKLDMEKWSSISVDLTTKNFVGCPGVAAFNPINDETAGYIVNQIINVYLNWIKVNGIKYDINRRTARMNSLAVQPYLLYVLKEVLRYEGYTIERNDFDCEPWNRILIASVNITSKIAGALPHWSVYTFIDEVRKLFNASIIFDETNKKVKILSTNEMTSNDYVVYDCLDEYSTEYNEDGVVTMATANVEYDFYDSAERDWREYVPQDVLRNYPTKEYSTKEALMAAAMAMEVRERRSTIFKVDNDLYIYAMMPKDGNPDAEDTEEKCVRCGVFNAIMRDLNSDSSVSLRISPVAVFQRKRRRSDTDSIDKLPNCWVCVPTMPNDRTSSEDVSYDESGEEFVSVQDAMQGADIDSGKESDDQKMAIMFQGVNVVNILKGQACPYNTLLPDEATLARYPVTLTDYHKYPAWVGEGETASLSLSRGVTSAWRDAEGRWHFGSRYPSTSSRGQEVKIDTHNLFCIKFPTDDIPNPSKIHIFNNRRFICQKIEMEVSDGTISRLKTGYFYEIL